VPDALTTPDDSCDIDFKPNHLASNISSRVKIDVDSDCVEDGDVAVFLLVPAAPPSPPGSPPSAELVSCAGAEAAAANDDKGGVVEDMRVVVSLDEGTYKMCVSKTFATTGGGFTYAGEARLYVDDNIRTRPWEPHVSPEPEDYEHTDCTMSDLFCKHNLSAVNTSSTAYAGNVETGHKGENRTERARRRMIDWGGIGGIGGSGGINGSGGSGGDGHGDRNHWGIHGLDWGFGGIAGEGFRDASPPAPPPPPLSPGEAWQDLECDLASWVCPKNRTRSGRSALGPGGNSHWKKAITSDEHREFKGIGWWWLLVMLLLLLLCCCCVFCFLGCSRTALAPTPVVGAGAGFISVVRPGKANAATET